MEGAVRHLTMAPRRLTDREKQELVGRYKAGESTAALAEAYSCSPNTVSRTVKALLPAEAYQALKSSRQKSKPSAVEPEPSQEVIASSDSTPEPVPSPDLDAGGADESDDPGTLALDDAEDFGDEPDEDSDEDDSSSSDFETFQELVPLADVGNLNDNRRLEPLPLTAGLLPTSVYMLVDKVVELDAKPLSDFPELGPLDETEQQRQGLCLYSSPRTAKRQCGRSQRVIKVPDTSVFELTSSYLLARGITRLVMEGTLIAIDSDE